jgi:hypothetical protein
MLPRLRQCRGSSYLGVAFDVQDGNVVISVGVVPEELQEVIHSLDPIGQLRLCRCSVRGCRTFLLAALSFSFISLSYAFRMVPMRSRNSDFKMTEISDWLSSYSRIINLLHQDTGNAYHAKCFQSSIFGLAGHCRQLIQSRTERVSNSCDFFSFVSCHRSYPPDPFRDTGLLGNDEILDISSSSNMSK